MGHLLGYARASTTDQHPQLQVDALTAAGCYRVFTEAASGARADRPILKQFVGQLRPGDTSSESPSARHTVDAHAPGRGCDHPSGTGPKRSGLLARRAPHQPWPDHDPLLAGPPTGRIEPHLPGVDHIQAAVFWQIFWQAARAAEAGRPFVLVGVTGFEPVASAV
jgi:hypothetical protein